MREVIAALGQADALEGRCRGLHGRLEAGRVGRARIQEQFIVPPAPAVEFHDDPFVPLGRFLPGDVARVVAALERWRGGQLLVSLPNGNELRFKFDPDKEVVIGDQQANALLNQPEYRAPYVVPDKV